MKTHHKQFFLFRYCYIFCLTFLLGKKVADAHFQSSVLVETPYLPNSAFPTTLLLEFDVTTLQPNSAR